MKRFAMMGLVCVVMQAHAFDVMSIVEHGKKAYEHYQAKKTTGGTANTDCASKMLSGQPVDNNGYNATLRCYSEYVAAFDVNTMTPRYTSEILTRARVEQKVPRAESFQPDPGITSPSTNEYSNTGWDRGHMSPAANMSNTTSMAESFYTTNIVPQHPGNNRAIWESLESKVRNMSEGGRTLEVVTGPVFTKKELITNKKGQTGRIWVPQYVFKVIRDVKTNDYAAYLVPNKPYGKGEYSQFLTDIATINKASGYNIMPKARLKKPIDINQW